MKLTRAKLQEIINEEYQKMVNEEEAMPMPPGQGTTPPQQDSQEQIKGKSQLIQYLKKECADKVREQSGIQSQEILALVDLMDLLLDVVGTTSLDASETKRIEDRIVQITSVKVD